MPVERIPGRSAALVVTTLALLLAVALGPAAQAGHLSQNCQTGAAFLVTPTYGTCSFTLTCPLFSGHVCRYALSMSASGVGVLQAQLSYYGGGPPTLYCSGLNSCFTSESGHLVLGGTSKNFFCGVTGEPVVVIPRVTCTATAT